MDVTGYKPQETCCLLLKNGGRLTFSFQVDTSFEARSLDARLYNADVSRDLRTSLVEEYANEERPTDGEIYRKIRRYHFERSVTLERRWWTWLTPHGAKPLKQLLRNDLLTAAFDALLKIPGVWVGMRISTLLKMLAIRCDEEILRYPDYVEEFWANLLGAADLLDRGLFAHLMEKVGESPHYSIF